MTRFINIALILAFMLCYTEWGQHYSAFIFQIQYEMLFNKGATSDALSHPLILAGLAGQLSLLYTTFTNGRPAWLNMAGILLLGMIVLLFLLIGILSANGRIILSTLPFISVVVIFFFVKRRQKIR